MGLFNFFTGKNGHASRSEANSKAAETKPDIPEDVFIKKENRDESLKKEVMDKPSSDHGINLLFQFLERNFEGKGYDDALMNPDTTHLVQNTEALRNDLERTIRKVKTFYEDFIREVDFHIASRGRTGMIDTVEELTMKKITAEQHIRQIKEIEEEADKAKGVGQGIIISYTRGFKNGLAAISHHTILKKTF